MLGFLQIVTQLLLLVDVPWPSYYQIVVSYLEFVNLNPVPLHTIYCLTEWSFFLRFIVAVSIPAGLIVFSCMLILIPLAIQDKIDVTNNPEARASRRSVSHSSRVELIAAQRCSQAAGAILSVHAVAQLPRSLRGCSRVSSVNLSLRVSIVLLVAVL